MKEAKKYPEDEELLEDTIIEKRQAPHMPFGSMDSAGLFLWSLPAMVEDS